MKEQSHIHESRRPAAGAGRNPILVGALAGLILLLLLPLGAVLAQDARPSEPAARRCFALELHVADAEQQAVSQAVIREALANRPGVTLRVFNHARQEGQDRHRLICQHFQIAETSLPLLYGCGQAFVVPEEAERLQHQLRMLLTMTVYVRSGCPHCSSAREYLRQVTSSYPGLSLVYRDLANDATAARDAQALVERYQKRAVSVPVFHFCNQLIVGYDRADTTGRQVTRILESWSHPCPAGATTTEPRPREHSTSSNSTNVPRPGIPLVAAIVQKSVTSLGTVPRWTTSQWLAIQAGTLTMTFGATGPEEEADEEVEDHSPGSDADGFEEAPLLPLPPLPAEPGEPFLPAETGEPDLPWPLLEGPRPYGEEEVTEEIDLPLFGRLSVDSLGLPLFTLAVGLVDGFNPCAMWVLLFLLSILVNLQDRWKILAVAGSFVLISGLAYFAFMAAWLSVFQFIGLLRPAQIVLGLLGVGIGIVHVKDFFAFKQGISFSIPESAKPTIYARVRSIVHAEHLLGAILGAATLAVLVNLIELLCTAGLPAMYTSILAMQQLPLWQEYAYLALYIVAYMFDDSLMVAIVVITLGRRKLQERQGRWLKLISGGAILALGLVMLFRPEWLI